MSHPCQRSVRLPIRLKEILGKYEGLFGGSFLLSQMYLLAVGLSVYAIQWLLTGHAALASTLLYTFFAGNGIAVLLSLFAPLYSRTSSSESWSVFLALLVPLSILASTFGGVLSRLVLGTSLHSLEDWRTGDIPFGALVVFALGALSFSFIRTRTRMEAANQLLAQQVQHGRQQIESLATDLQAAFDIQSNLLPRTIPQIAGVEISCAWQPARTVSGDFFDVVVLSESRIGFCLADVSGKGMSAALITANLQAIFRAFARDEQSPAKLCQLLNEVLCTNLPTGRFVTMAYGILDRERMTLTYELAGHNAPLLLRDREARQLPGTGPVLGLLPDAVFADQILTLQPDDRLLLCTDGVTEAFSPTGEEFGEDRMVAAALASAGSAHSIRTEIMREVHEFTEGNFHDDASVMAVRVLP